MLSRWVLMPLPPHGLLIAPATQVTIRMFVAVLVDVEVGQVEAAAPDQHR